ncbi:MAG: sulfatase-like hydrolase/transferase [Akkermansiaceae bacterium]|nr:sulfatase-like hydrolase/transferase [Akkermansiaceae bacterium]
MPSQFYSILGAGLLSVVALAAEPPAKPNIVFILADDLGYGDVHCLNPEHGKIATPMLDQLAAQGMAFTEAHSSSAVCTPTRYGILTGRYNWRSRLQQGVLLGYSTPLIAADRLTVPALLKQHGYATACIGKWHLGMTISKEDPHAPVGDGPLTRGFDQYFGISASLDMAPFAFIENDHFTEAPTAEKQWVRKGAAAPGFEAVDVLPTLTRKAVEFIGDRATAKQPFFLYLPLASPHTPIVPTKEWQGKSGIGKYGDFVMETDWAVGEVLAALEKNGVAGNTLVIFTSDNGCSPAADTKGLEQQGHLASAGRRGYKADIFDGGHRIPFLARWPGQIKPGTRSDQAICLTDLMATCAGILDAKLPDNAGEDSVSLLPAFLGTADQPLHEAVVHHSINGSFAIRQGQWKLALCPDSGGWSEPKPGKTNSLELPPVQLFDTTKDIAEQTNEAAAHPEVVARLTKLLERIVADGRSTTGPPQRNDAEIVIHKGRKEAAPKTQANRTIHAAQDGLALTPPMGWYPWNMFGQEPQNEQLIRDTVAALIASGMKDAGYSYVGPDEGICFSRGDDGKLTTNLARYPSGLRGLGDHIHRQGLKYALYTDAGTLTCSKAMPGTKDHEVEDMQSFADWRTDYLKIDWCNTKGQEIIATYTKLHDAQHTAGRPLVHSLCSWGAGEPWLWGALVGHLWRTTGDICGPGKANWPEAMSIVAQNEKLSQWARPGGWNDPDMLIVGMPGLSKAQNRTIFSLWCMMAAPLMAGNDLRDMTPETIRILTNKEAVGVNQDPLGVQGRIVRAAGKVDVWAGKPLFDGSQAVLLVNRGASPETVSLKLSEIGFPAQTEVFVRDLWRHGAAEAVSGSDGVRSFEVDAGDVVFLRVAKSNGFPLPPVIVADSWLVSLRAGGTAPEKLTGVIRLANKGSTELPPWRVAKDLPAWLAVAVTKEGNPQTITTTVATASLKKGLYHAVVRLDNTEPVSGKPMSAVYFDVDLEVPEDIAGGN